MNGQSDAGLAIMTKANGAEAAQHDLEEVHKSLAADANKEKARLTALFAPALRLVLLIGIVIAVVQQITGINAVFFYAPMIFEQSGIGTNAAFMQAVLVGLVNLAFTVVAILLIDRLGRRPLLITGLAGVAITMTVLAYGFWSASYTLEPDAMDTLPDDVAAVLMPLAGETFDSDLAFKEAVRNTAGPVMAQQYQSEIITSAIEMNSLLILFGILTFVASFAVSVGPVMWVLFSELFPNRVRGIAISFVGLINSAVSWAVQQFFPWELANLGNALTFLLYGAFAVLGLAFVITRVPETKGKSLEELESFLSHHKKTRT